MTPPDKPSTLGFAATLLAPVRSNPRVCATSAPVEVPDREDLARPAADEGWIVTVYNNDHNTYEEVITILVIATGCSVEDAYIEAWEIDHLGKSVVHRAGESECLGVADVIATIGIRVEATPEP